MESERERDPPLPSLELTSTPGVGVYGTGIEGRSSLKAVSIVDLVSGFFRPNARYAHLSCNTDLSRNVNERKEPRIPRRMR